MRNTSLKQAFFFGIGIPLALGLGLAGASSTIEVQLEKLPEEFSLAAEKGRERLGSQISQAFYDRLSNWSYDVPLSSGSHLGVQAGRTVFSNEDVEESYTVMDRLSLPLTLPGVSLPLGIPGASFSLGLSGRLDFTNLRVVKPSDSFYKETLIHSLLGAEDLEARRSQIENSDWLKLASEQALEASPAEYLQGPDSQNAPLFSLDSLRSARYGRLWNQFSHPLRLPLKASWLSRLDDHEVVTYGGSGTIEIGPSFGLDYFSGKAGAQVRAYLTGDFKISMMRVARKRARVKITRAHHQGVSASEGGQAEANLFPGFLLVTTLAGQEIKSTLATLQDTLIPIQFEKDQNWGKSFEIAYEYDLSDERGIRAYEQAVLGRMALSDSLSVALKPEGERAAVRRLFSRQQDMIGESREIKIHLNFLNKTASGNSTFQDAMIEFPDGTTHLLKGSTQSSFSTQMGYSIWKELEQVSYSIRTDYLENAADPQHTGQFAWFAEGKIQDNSTTGIEMNRYASMIESLFFEQKIFPRLPQFIPLTAEEEMQNNGNTEGQTITPEEASYGYSLFSFRVALSPSQLFKLTQIPDEKLWKALEKGFERFDGAWSTPLNRWVARLGGWFYNTMSWGASIGQVDQRLGIRFSHADLFMDRLQEIRQIVGSAQSPEQLSVEQRRLIAKNVADLYSDQVFQYELIKTTLVAMKAVEEKQISYHLTARSSAFPSIDLDGDSITELEKVTQRYATETDFDQPGIRTNLDLALSQIGLTIMNKDLFQLRFTTKSLVPLLLIKVDEVSEMLRITTPIKRLLIPNRGQFPSGESVVSLDAKQGVGFRGEIAQALQPGHIYRLTLAGVDQNTTGPANSIEFKVPAETSPKSDVLNSPLFNEESFR